jgi:hypothetical protein
MAESPKCDKTKGSGCNSRILAFNQKVVSCHTVITRPHRVGRYLEGLNEEGADAQDYDGHHQEELHVIDHRGLRVDLATHAREYGFKGLDAQLQFSGVGLGCDFLA